MHVGDWGSRGATYWPEHIAVTDEARGLDFTYVQMDKRSDALAGWLRSAGVTKGDRVGAIAHNGVEVLDLLFACGKLGAVLVPYNWRLTAPELAGLLKMTAPKVLFVSHDLAPTAAAAMSASEGLALIHPAIDLGDAAKCGAEYERIVSQAHAPVREESLQTDDTFVLLFTGGTTGLPKAAKLSHRMVTWNVLTTTVHHLRHHDVTVVHTPMFHTGGLFVHAVPAMATGGRVIVLRKWDADVMLGLIAREKVTVAFAVPTQLQQMAESAAFAKTDLSSVRMFISGGAPLPLPLLDTYGARNIPLAQGFGLTEFGPNALMLSAEDAKAHPGSVGRPNSFVDAQVVGADGTPVAEGEVGELCLKGEALASGYLAETGETTTLADEHGWFHTGDLARWQKGQLYIAGRMKEMFISGGENVYPLEVEAVLQAHPSVRSAAVVGVADAKWGEVGHAYIVPAEGAAIPEAELRAYLKSQLAGYKVPKVIHTLDALPLTAAGKVAKRQLIELSLRSGAPS